MSFELFAHATEFFGQPHVFLGRFNGQGLGEAFESAARRTIVTVRPGKGEAEDDIVVSTAPQVETSEGAAQRQPR